MVILTFFKIPDIAQLLPPEFATIPEVLVTKPVLTVRTTEYVWKSVEQVAVGPLVINGV
jgi:hypothetical protein